MYDSQEQRPHRIMTDHDVIDEHQTKIGKVTDVLFMEADAEPQWATVHVGMFGGEHYIPLADAYQAEDGRVVVPYDKRTIKRAPKPNREHILSPEQEGQLRSYYGIAS